MMLRGKGLLHFPKSSSTRRFPAFTVFEYCSSTANNVSQMLQNLQQKSLGFCITELQVCESGPLILGLLRAEMSLETEIIKIVTSKIEVGLCLLSRF